MKRSKVLIIDDAKMIHALVRAYLEGEAAEVCSARSGAEGISMARTARPDLVLLDVEMPDLTGWDVCRQLKADGDTKDVPVIFLSAESDTAQKIRGLDLGAVDYIAKPFDPAELKARVRSALRTKELIDLLAEQAMMDGLTGLRNRRYFEHRLSTCLSAARRHGQPLSCVIVDVDHFKQVNDRHGHAVGDEVLRAAADHLRGRCRSEDVVCRIGGEEFAYLLPHTCAAQAATFAADVREGLAGLKFPLREGSPLTITASFGVADLANTGPGELMPAADAALYQAKRSGRNRVVTHRQALAA